MWLCMERKVTKDNKRSDTAVKSYDKSKRDSKYLKRYVCTNNMSKLGNDLSKIMIIMLYLTMKSNKQTGLSTAIE